MTSYKPRGTLVYVHALYPLLESPLQEYDHGPSILNTHKNSQLMPYCEDPMATSEPRAVGEEAADGLYESSQPPSSHRRGSMHIYRHRSGCVFIFPLPTQSRRIEDLLTEIMLAQLQAVYVVYVVSPLRTRYQGNYSTLCNASIPMQDT